MQRSSLRRPFWTASAALLIGCSGVTIDFQYLQDSLPPQVTAEIEERGFYLARAGDLEAVYYLALVDSAADQVRVGYFLVWPGEYPDFGNHYPARAGQVVIQLLTPLAYTNWLYLPGTGGLQRLLYGPGDVEGVAVLFTWEDRRLIRIESVGFEQPGHEAAVIPDPALPWSLADVTHNNAPSLVVASWNHLFLPPDTTSSPVRMEVSPFPPDEWRRLKMHRRRAEVAKLILLAGRAHLR